MSDASERSFTGARWIASTADAGRIREIQARSGLSEVAARILATRWDGDVPDQAWETPSFDHLHDPWSMRNMDAATDRLRRALKARERIRIITDYDVDGTTSSLILQATLRMLAPDCEVDYHIPNRFDEGYGFSVRAAQEAAASGAGLVVTADIGVRDHAAVDAARDAGVDVLICDHHLPAGADVPERATVLCPPQRGDAYPNRALAACGVSLKLAQALLAEHPKRDAILRSMLKLAAIGTVADLVPLTTRENRAIVALGLEELNRGPHHPGLAALLAVSQVQGGKIRASNLGFQIGPRINAAGRVADAKLVIELLHERDPSRAAALAEQINALNTKRRAIQGHVEEAALAMLGESPPPFVVLADTEERGWHRGVVGIVASRIKDETQRPVAIVSIQGDTSVGSVRSIPGVHAVKALDAVSDLLWKYGGHPAAAGFTVATSDLPELSRRLSEHVAALGTDLDPTPIRTTDGEVAAGALGPELFAELTRLGPWGQGNPEPQLVVPGVTAKFVQTMSDGKHLKFQVPLPAGRPMEAVWWRQGELAGAVGSGPIDVLGTLGENHYRGGLQLEVRDVRPASR